MLFGDWLARNHLVDGVQFPQREWAIFGGCLPVCPSTESLLWCTQKTAEAIEMPFGGLTHWVQSRTNPFATARGDKMVTQPLSKILWALVIIIGDVMVVQMERKRCRRVFRDVQVLVASLLTGVCWFHLFTSICCRFCHLLNLYNKSQVKSEFNTFGDHKRLKKETDNNKMIMTNTVIN